MSTSPAAVLPSSNERGLDRPRRCRLRSAAGRTRSGSRAGGLVLEHAGESRSLHRVRRRTARQPGVERQRRQPSPSVVPHDVAPRREACRGASSRAPIEPSASRPLAVTVKYDGSPSEGGWDSKTGFDADLLHGHRCNRPGDAAADNQRFHGAILPTVSDISCFTNLSYIEGYAVTSSVKTLIATVGTGDPGLPAGDRRVRRRGRPRPRAQPEGLRCLDWLTRRRCPPGSSPSRRASRAPPRHARRPARGEGVRAPSPGHVDRRKVLVELTPRGRAADRRLVRSPCAGREPRPGEVQRAGAREGARLPWRGDRARRSASPAAPINPRLIGVAWRLMQGSGPSWSDSSPAGDGPGFESDRLRLARGGVGSGGDRRSSLVVDRNGLDSKRGIRDRGALTASIAVMSTTATMPEGPGVITSARSLATSGLRRRRCLPALPSCSQTRQGREATPARRRGREDDRQCHAGDSSPREPSARVVVGQLPDLDVALVVGIDDQDALNVDSAAGTPRRGAPRRQQTRHPCRGNARQGAPACPGRRCRLRQRRPGHR